MFGEKFQFVAQYAESNVSFKYTFAGKEAADEIEGWLLDVLSSSDVFVLGSLSVLVSHQSAQAVRIMETHTKNAKSYQTLVFMETKDDNVYVIN